MRRAYSHRTEFIISAAARQAQCVLGLLLVLASPAAMAQRQTSLRLPGTRTSEPPLALQARRFLAPRLRSGPLAGFRLHAGVQRPRPAASGSSSAWTPLGPAAVTSINYGLITGRVTSIALDPSDTTGNKLYVGTTGGGVWLSQNAGTAVAGNITFTPLTDNPGALADAQDASISIGAVSVQPGGTGVVLSGTGDPNDALDSYYGAGILRSTDGGNTWSLIQTTKDVESGLGIQDYSFVGEGFAGFAWSTVTPQLVVAAVSQAYEGALVNAGMPAISYEGLYYSSDSGATWHLATIADGGSDVQGPMDSFASPDGNAATAVVWNPVRQIFVAAVRYHGYYQSSDGIHWARMSAQPGTGLTTAACPTNPGMTGAVACPIFRGTLAVNPQTGDTFAWTVDASNQDQGIWQDECAISSGACTNVNVTFARQWNSAALETNTSLGSATIANGDYNLVLAAVPSSTNTLLLAGANDLWKCSLAAGCAWRNTTNAGTCMSAGVAGYEHALEWNAANPQEIFIGNDSGLWRSTDAVGETGTACDAGDASHFQNLNGGLGSLAEVESLSQAATSAYTMMAGLGVNGIAGTKNTSASVANWPEIEDGEGGPVAIDPTDSTRWYVNNQPGVAIHLCSQTGDCTPAAFGASPVVNEADVENDGLTMTTPAPFMVDPLDPAQLLVGTCRVWRGPADGSAWTGSNAISGFLDGMTGSSACNGNAQIRTMASLALPNGTEVIYVGLYGALDGGATLAGHVLRAIFDPTAGSMPSWQDLTLSPVSNDTLGMNAFGFDISSIYIDPHDTTGNTVYVTVEGATNSQEQVRPVYRTADGGANWAAITSNLPAAPANSIVIDPQDANTAYIATDAGVYSTQQIATCATAASNCWSAYGTGLPQAPVVELSVPPVSSSVDALTAATFGRGVWQMPLQTAVAQPATATIAPSSLIFPLQAYGTTSGAQSVTLTNTGSVPLEPTAISMAGDFAEADNCVNASIAAGGSCSIQVTFTPTQGGTRTGQMAISANVTGGQMTVDLSGTGGSPGPVSLAPATLDFGQVETGNTSPDFQVTLDNAGAGAIAISSVTASAPFALASNVCGSTLAANSSCQLKVDFAPTQTGPATGTLTVVDDAGTQTVALSGTGESAATDTLSPASLIFSGTVVGELSGTQTVTLTNSGDLALTSIAASTNGPFQAASGCGTQLAGNAACAISVQFLPTTTGTQTGTLTVSDALRTQTVALSGTGLAPPQIGVSPAAITFVALQLGAAGAQMPLSVSNTGGAPMSNVGFQITGPAAASYSTGASTCPSTLNNGSNCAVQVNFAPKMVGANSATLTVSSATLGVQAVNVALSGTGTVASGLSISPAQMSFTEPTLDQTSGAQPAVISNLSTVDATGLAVTANAPFGLVQNGCGTSLAAGATCSVSVAFTPTANGVVAGALTAASGTLSSATAALTGTGGAAGTVQLQPGLLSFSTTGVGLTSGIQAVTLTNTGVTALRALALGVSSGFQIQSNTCPGVLDVGASCTTGVVFAPTSAGVQSGVLTVTSGDLANAATVSLAGMGFDFTEAVSGTSSLTVASGQTARYTLNVTPLNGSSGTFTFQCGTLPAHAACSFNPSSLTVAANTTGSMTVQIATGQSATAAIMPRAGIWGAAGLELGLLLLPLGLRRKRRGLLVLLAAGALLVGLSSCSGAGGGGGATAAASGATPPGTYSIQVTAAANGVSHQLTVSMTVD
ncbi:MAG TPA: choice-of-anchor D domain-containing protein [Terracidiphilus sp.]|nr:choice-of-anchor D domain-containing protein [Terracidiphilus sp.]